jgi:hypothetical protein
MKKVALSLAFVFMMGTIAVNAQKPKTEVKKTPATEQKKPEVKKDEKNANAATPATPAKPAHKKKAHKKGAKVAKKVEATAPVAQ